MKKLLLLGMVLTSLSAFSNEKGNGGGLCKALFAKDALSVMDKIYDYKIEIPGINNIYLLRQTLSRVKVENQNEPVEFCEGSNDVSICSYVKEDLIRMHCETNSDGSLNKTKGYPAMDTATREKLALHELLWWEKSVNDRAMGESTRVANEIKQREVAKNSFEKLKGKSISIDENCGAEILTSKEHIILKIYNPVYGGVAKGCAVVNAVTGSGEITYVFDGVECSKMVCEKKVRKDWGIQKIRLIALDEKGFVYQEITGKTSYDRELVFNQTSEDVPQLVEKKNEEFVFSSVVKEARTEEELLSVCESQKDSFIAAKVNECENNLGDKEVRCQAFYGYYDSWIRNMTTKECSMHFSIRTYGYN